MFQKLNDYNESDETQIVYKQFNIYFKYVRLVYIYTQPTVGI